MQVRLAHLKDVIAFFQKVVWFIGFWATILQILLTEISKNGWLSKNSGNYFNFGVDVWNLFSFFRGLFSFTARIFLLPRAFFFCRNVFLFRCEHFSFTTGIFLLSQAFFFWCNLLLFCSEYFAVTTRLFFLPWPFLFCRKHFLLPRASLLYHWMKNVNVCLETAKFYLD